MLKRAAAGHVRCSQWALDLYGGRVFPLEGEGWEDAVGVVNPVGLLLVGLDAEPLARAAAARFCIEEGAYARVVGNSRLALEEEVLWRRYLPLLFFPLRAHRLGRAVVISHFAQSLDGRVATATGDSKWIGDEQNLEHAHRLRALCDAVLVGHGTVRADAPQLTVRRVEGPQPLRLWLCRRLPEGFQAEEGLRVLCAREDLKQPAQEGVEYFCADGPQGTIPPEAVLKWLYGRGYCSLLLEGGHYTATGFLRAGYIDVLQLHIAPLLVGSTGIPPFSPPGVEKICEAIRFSAHVFEPVGDGVMFTGTLNGASF